jgi:hypothetical protein
MVSTTGTQHRHVPPATAKHGPADKNPAAAPGKSAQSVGHLAKAMVAESGDTAPNAIGKAAAMIAKMRVEAPAPAPTPIPEPEPEPTPDPTPTDTAPTDPAPTDPAPTDPAPTDPVPAPGDGEVPPTDTASLPTDPIAPPVDDTALLLLIQQQETTP